MAAHHIPQGQAGEENREYSNFRWVMLALSWMGTMTGTWGQMMISPLAKPLMSDFGLDHAALMAVLGAPILLSIFLSIPGGLLADRFGLKKMIFIGGVIAGTSMVLRGFATNYTQFFVLTVLFGIGPTISMPNTAKLVHEWFPRNQVATAAGINATAAGSGLTIALALTYPIFGFDWRAASWGIGGLALGAALIWFIFAKETRAPVVRRPAVPVLTGLMRVSKTPDVWLCGLITAFNIGGAYIFMSQLPLALETLRSLSPGTAGAMASMVSFGAALGGNLITPILSDRIGLRKPFLSVSAVTGATLLFLVWVVPYSPATWVLAFLGGTSAGTVAVISGTVLIGHKGIPFEIQGSARGLMASVGSGGRYLLMLLGGYVSEWRPGYTATFFVAAIMVLMVLFLTMPVTETGPKAVVAERARGA